MALQKDTRPLLSQLFEAGRFASSELGIKSGYLNVAQSLATAISFNLKDENGNT